MASPGPGSGPDFVLIRFQIFSFSSAGPGPDFIKPVRILSISRMG